MTAGLPTAAIQLVPTSDRAAVGHEADHSTHHCHIGLGRIAVREHGDPVFARTVRAR